jgi:hypothetical protein
MTVRSFLKNNLSLVINLFLVAWCIMWLVIGVEWPSFWWFMLGFSLSGVFYTGLNAWSWYESERFLEDLRQRCNDIEWDSQWEPTAAEIENIEKGYN